MNQPSIQVIIPTRLHSSRLPGKPLLPSNNGLPHVINLLSSLESWVDKTNFHIATDSCLIEHVVSKAGYQCVITPEAMNGTERIAMAVRDNQDLYADWIINIQGDLINVGKSIGDQILNGIYAAEESGVTYVTYASAKPHLTEDSKNQGSVWVEVNSKNHLALDFGRAQKPELSDGSLLHSHIGVYAYKVQTLVKYLGLNVTDRELSLSLEQMRFVDNGIFPFIAYLDQTPLEVNTEDDQINRLIREENHGE